MDKDQYNAYHREYQKKLYQSDPEYKEKRKKQILDKYHSTITEERRKVLCERSKAYYQRKKAEKLAQQSPRAEVC
jgi:hypothetical protein